VSDLRGLAATDLGSLLLPVSRFLKERVKQEVPVMCSAKTTFGTVLHRLVHHGLHRLWCTVSPTLSLCVWCVLTSCVGWSWLCRMSCNGPSRSCRSPTC
jgi:hypothetical protein